MTKNKEKKAIVELVKEFFKECPYLSELSKINVDYLNIESKDFEYWSIEPESVPLIIKRNVLGTKTTRQFQFVLATRTFFNKFDDNQNIKNLQIFEQIAEWLYQCNKQKNLPILNEDEKSISIECTSPGSLYGVSKDITIARYQMICKLEYEKYE